MQIEPPTYTTDESMIDRAMLVISSDERNKDLDLKKVVVETQFGTIYRLDAYKDEKLVVFGSPAIACGVEGSPEGQTA